MSKTWLMALGFLVLSSCGRHAATSGPANLQSVPSATGASWALGTEVVTATGFTGQRARDGIKLSGLASFCTAGHGNPALCSIGDVMKSLYRNAARTDRLKCFTAAVEGIGAFAPNLYDGKVHLFSLLNLNGGTTRARIVANKNGDGVVTDFTLWAAAGGNSQTDYFGFRNEDGAIKVSEVSTSQRLQISGTVNTGGVWTSAKSLVATASNGSTRQHTTIVESSGALDFTTAAQSAQSELVATGILQVLVPASGRVADVALGGGTVRYQAKDSGVEGSGQVVGWNGDTGELVSPAADADYFATVEARTLPAMPTSFDVAFRPDFSETWTPPDDLGLVIDVATAPPALATALTDCQTRYDFADSR